MTEFEGVVPALGQALSKRGYTVLTPVQKAVLSPELKEADLLVSAQTGSGKTVAFGLTLGPTLLDGADQFARAKAPLALAVAPTRELAMQLKRELEWLYVSTGAIIASCVGGMDMRAERQALGRGAHIVVGTPGRLRDHIERGSFDTTGLRAVVLDEADEMLDLGFREDLEYILDAAPKDRRTLMFSATVPRTIASLAKRYQRNAVRIATTAEQKQHLDIQYRALTVAPNDRENAIINLLRYVDPKSALVFCGTRAMVNHMTSRFTNRGFSVVALSGELSQNERSHALQAMRDGRARVCIATDVAARGIDLPNLDLVIHADIPKNREILLHRSGRTGRAGRKGVCVLIVPHPVRRRTEQLLRSANVEAEWAKPPSLQDIMRVDRERILDDPALSEPLSEDEKLFAGELLARHGAEQVAASFLRMHRAGLPGPEELLDAAPLEDPKPKRDDFKGGVWFSLSVGRKHSAEPRWLLPMLCRAGHITKREIGAIKVLPDETHVELASECVERFLEALGPSRKVEKTITVTRLEGAPSGGRGGDKPHGAKRPYSPAKPGYKRKSFQGPDASGPKTPAGEVKPWEKPSKKRKPQGPDAGGPSTPAGEVKPWEKSPKKRKPKKLGKPKRSTLTTK
ncbi:MAG: ATP-dependent RNA helicase DeaD [Alphaproteobacteria bacterium]|jgi:ATP-dependent RNA helicase DeaD